MGYQEKLNRIRQAAAAYDRALRLHRHLARCKADVRFIQRAEEECRRRAADVAALMPGSEALDQYLRSAKQLFEK